MTQLDFIRHDLDGDGVSTHSGYAAAFPNAMDGMGCPDGCSGYEIERGAITASYTTSDVIGNSYVGGLVGYSQAAITATYTTGSVTGNYSVGGLVGYTLNVITASYATGSVTGSDSYGALLGSGERYYTRVADSYWDTQTTGLSRSYGGGIGKTTRELQVPTGATGIYANWNAEWWDFGAFRQYPVLKYPGMNVAAQRR